LAYSSACSSQKAPARALKGLPIFLDDFGCCPAGLEAAERLKTTLPFSAVELGRVLAAEPACGLPRAAYVDERVFAYEREHLFGRCWTCVGREQELGAPGDFLLAQVAGEELLVVRGADLELRAFYNVCRHRGLRLVEVERARAPDFTCAYHGWVYELSGELRAAPYLPASFQRNCAGLRPVRLAQLLGFLWVSLAPQSEALEVALAGAPLWLTRPELAHLRLGRAVAHEVAANWKLVVENFQESHHFQLVHPELEAQTPNANAGTWSSAGAWLGGTMELASGLRTVANPGGRAAAAHRTRGRARTRARRAGVPAPPHQPSTRLPAEL
jgi:Rieske 2Fe-2S family protein